VTNQTPHQILNEVSQRNRQTNKTTFELQNKLEEEGIYKDFFNEVRMEADKEKRKGILLKYAKRVNMEERIDEIIQDLFN